MDNDIVLVRLLSLGTTLLFRMSFAPFMLVWQLAWEKLLVICAYENVIP
jgi:hypothetical protein